MSRCHKFDDLSRRHSTPSNEYHSSNRKHRDISLKNPMIEIRHVEDPFIEMDIERD